MLAHLLGVVLAASVPSETQPSPSAPMVRGAEATDTSIIVPVIEFSSAEATRAKALVKRPDCDVANLVCAQGRRAMIGSIRVQRATLAQNAYPLECHGPPEFAPKGCREKGIKALEAVMGVDEFMGIEMSISSWPNSINGPPEYVEMLAGRAREAMAGDRCPSTSIVCTAGRWAIIADLAGAYGGMYCDLEAATDPNCPSRREAGLSWVKQSLLRLLQTSGWPRLPVASLSASAAVGTFLADPEVTSVALPLWKTARQVGKAESYAHLEDLVEWKASRSQLYGTLGQCEGKGTAAVFAPYPIVDPGAVEQRRAEAREPAFATWVAEQSASCRRIAVD